MQRLFVVLWVVGSLVATSCGDDVGVFPRSPPAVLQSPRAFLLGWAEPEGDEKDAVTGFPSRVKRTKDEMRMVLVPAGTFQMGAVPGDTWADDDEKPRHRVTLSKAYYLDESEVTIAMWEKYGAETGAEVPRLQYPPKSHACPMHEVSWDAVQGYLRWANVSLPTEAQWERAAKGGHDEFLYPWGTQDDVRMRNGKSDEDGYGGLAPVKSFAPNAYGLYDMSGNVWEWCADGYDADYYPRSPPTDPVGPTGLSLRRLARGGGWTNDFRGLRVSNRHSNTPVDRGSIVVGFRCARSLP